MKALVTGGGGFLGGAIVRMLKERGDDVVSFSRGSYPMLEQLGVEQFRGALEDADAVHKAAAGCDIVFHVAAKAGIWGDYASYHAANVTGTENVIRTCREHGIQRLVHTSSPSVVFNGQDMEGVDERAPYASDFVSHYPKTKALAEESVLTANDSNFATTALRPHLIWGPGDNHLVPRILEKGRKKQLRRIGKRPCKVDSVYIQNAAEAHILAGDVLKPGSQNAGKPYFISNGEPMPVWDLVDSILAAGGQPPVSKTIPVWLAKGAGVVLEVVHGVLGLEAEPRMTRFVAKELSSSHWFDISAARRDFGYSPRITIQEGLSLLKQSLR
ncbi:NAD-dependent epimerase/dehydratase family protein [Verrucomicrobia bacterium]|nr:NAD-dependent epimerase/dehydratase family protein [Verrucomicrobiota bacterium]